MKSCLSWLLILGDLFRLVALDLRSKSSLAAENLFLRKQLALLSVTQDQAPKNRQFNTPDTRLAKWVVRLANRIGRDDA